MPTAKALTRPQLIDALRKLADNMESIGSAMDYYGGFAAHIADHGNEIMGAALVARGWADGIENELEELK
tara:strand:+ start:13001 stop:13210 length:210 start_codon:yes stop_codon:yes gene_type:complete